MAAVKHEPHRRGWEGLGERGPWGQGGGEPGGAPQGS